MIINGGLSQGPKTGIINNATGEYRTNWYLTSDGMGEISFNENNVIGYKTYNPGGKVYLETVIELSREYVTGERYVVSFDAHAVDYPKAKIKASLKDEFGNETIEEFVLKSGLRQYQMVVAPNQKTNYRLRVIFHDKENGVVNAQCKNFYVGNFKMERGIEPSPYPVNELEDITSSNRVYKVFDGLYIDICKVGSDRFTATATWIEPMIQPPKVSFSGLTMTLVHGDNQFKTNLIVDTKCVLNSNIGKNGITVKCFFEEVHSGTLSLFFSKISDGEWFKGIVHDHVVFDSRMIP